MEFISVIAAKIVESMVEPVGQWLAEHTVVRVRQWLGYPFQYNINIKNLKNGEIDLKAARDRVQHSVDAAKRNTEEIEPDVNEWLERVDVILGNAREILEGKEEANMRCSIGACLNLKVRCQQSEKAKNIVQEINEEAKKGRFSKVSYRNASHGTRTYVNYMPLESRTSTVKGLMDALRDDTIKMIGVWGMPGAGKTTLVSEVSRQAKEEKLFNDVTMSAVMQSPNLRRIQGEIADMLDLKFDKETVLGRADRLRKRLEKDKKVLVILDDIWKKVDLEEIGIPCNGCKVVLTSRNRDVLSSEMGTQQDFELRVLPQEEAWSLFEKTVGDSLKDPNLQSIATQVCEECAGLPVALVTVAKALKNKSLFEWKDALQQLRRPSPAHLTSMQATIYSKIKLSYKHLGSPVVQSFFLLCGQMSSPITYPDLLRYCFGLCLFHGINTLEDARNRVSTLVRILQDSCLLLEDPLRRDYFRMHDLVRDVAILIAKDGNMLTMINEDPVKWPDEDAIRKCTRISILNSDIHELPDRLECPKLEFLFVYAKENGCYFKIADTFFKGMRKLKVLDLTRMRLSSLPSSINLLTNLQTLCLDQCVLGDIDVIGELKNLDILSLGYSEVKQLPRQIGLLTHLRMLDLRNCTIHEVIPPNVLSPLIHLEELYVSNSFTQWGVEGLNDERASLAELKHLSQLTTLEVHIPDANMLPKDLDLLFSNLKRYKIFVGDVWGWFDNPDDRALKLKLNTSFQSYSGIKMLLNGTEDLCLDELKGIKSVLCELDMEGFQQLKHLHLQNNAEIKYITDSTVRVTHVVFPSLEVFSLQNLINLEEICHCPLPSTSFHKLRVVRVVHCDKLKFVFPSSIAKGFSQLEELEIRECNDMGAIVVEVEGEIEDRNMIFPQLRRLALHRLPKLMSFISKQNSFITDAGEIIPERELQYSLMPILQEQVH
uniref:AAA+ ATPase domain-containing protein n=1 Tax=Fagus sylvatica TaxID=28930 RepID=A0A2N9GY40_FAGSY